MSLDYPEIQRDVHFMPMPWHAMRIWFGSTNDFALEAIPRLTGQR